MLEQLEGVAAATGGGVVGGVLCAGLSCFDMQLLQASRPSSDEAIARFAGHASAPGGSTSNTASALRALRVGAAVLTCVGEDANGAYPGPNPNPNPNPDPDPDPNPNPNPNRNPTPPQARSSRARTRGRASTRGCCSGGRE